MELIFYLARGCAMAQTLVEAIQLELHTHTFNLLSLTVYNFGN